MYTAGVCLVCYHHSSMFALLHAQITPKKNISTIAITRVLSIVFSDDNLVTSVSSWFLCNGNLVESANDVLFYIPTNFDNSSVQLQ